MQEIKVERGKICDNGMGCPVMLDGLKATLQRVYNRLNVIRGSFRYDRTLGSRIPEMDVRAENADRLALRYAQEALLPCPEVRVEAAWPGEDRVVVTVVTPLGQGEVNVYLKECEE